MRFNIFESIDFTYQSYERNAALTNQANLKQSRALKKFKLRIFFLNFNPWNTHFNPFSGSTEAVCYPQH